MDPTGPTPQSRMGAEAEDGESPEGGDATVQVDVEKTEAAATELPDREDTLLAASNAGAPPPSGPPGAWPSALPTQRPGRKSSVFSRLLAEAGTALDGEKTLAQPAPGASAEAKEAPKRRERAPGPSLASYRILSELGSGGMAVVYKAVQPSLDRLVAIKELRHDYLSDAQIRARFEREATSLAAIQHGNIVHIYDFIHDDENAYIIMEFVDGIDLFDLLEETGPLPPDVASVIGLQLAEALEYAHYRGIVHRDIKPSNILISRTGEVKVMDFGIARDAERVDLTQVGMALGTPAYMSPEQIAGDHIDFRSDIFCFGIVFYEMLTGRRPWGQDEEGRTITRKVLYEPHLSPRTHNPGFLPELEAIIDRCLNKDPEARYRSTHQLRREIERFVAREVSVDPRQRLVTYLRNRAILSDGEASSFVDRDILADPVYRRRDLGVASPPSTELIRPLMFAAAGAALLVLLGGVLGAMTSYGDRLPEQKPKVTIRTPR